MLTQEKIKIDRLVGGPFAYLLNLATRVLGFLLKRDHRFPQSPGVICVAKFTGLGSIMAATPMLQALKDRYPKAIMVFISSRKNSPLLERLGCIDQRLYVSENSFGGIVGTTLGLLWRLWRLRPTLYFDLELYSYYASMVATLSCARNRLGFYRKSTRVKKGLFTHLIFFNTAAPVHLLYLQLARTAGCQAPLAGLEPGPLLLQPADREEATSVLGGWLQPSEELLAVNPNASDLCLERRWPEASFVQSIGGLLEKLPNLKVALVGSPEEATYVAEIAAELSRYGGRVRNLAGELSFGGFLALLQQADCFLTNDSGPMHLAFALDRPTVALFGPSHPLHYATKNAAHALILYEPVVCSPCLFHSDLPPCAGDNQCLQLLRVESVVTACRALLQAPEIVQPDSLPQVWQPLLQPHQVVGAGDQPLGRVILRHHQT
jgi:ADP-heptose:LPS heptosyltransferase